MNLDQFPIKQRKAAQQALDSGNAQRFIELADEDNDHLRIIADNSADLLERGIYEWALLEAYAEGASSNHGWSIAAKQRLFDLADRDRLKAAGHALPFDNHRFTIYRGVSGSHPYRQVRSFSWTIHQHWAVHFATCRNLADPAVYKAVIHRDEILAYWNGRGEGEVIVRPRRFERIEMEAILSV